MREEEKNKLKEDIEYFRNLKKGDFYSNSRYCEFMFKIAELCWETLEKLDERRDISKRN